MVCAQTYDRLTQNYRHVDEHFSVGVEFEYIEQDPYNKTPEWLAINPRGLVPVLIRGDHKVYESSICIEYLEDFLPEKSPYLLPKDAYQRAKARLLADHISKKIVPPFYAILQKKTTAERSQANDAILQGLVTLMNDAHADGPFLMGSDFSLPDVMLAPWAHRFDVVLRHYRGFVVPGGDDDATGAPDENAEAFRRYHTWYRAVQQLDCYKKTLADRTRLIDSYQRYADDTVKSQVGDAIRSGTALP